jgi:hypothetical protein
MYIFVYKDHQQYSLTFISSTHPTSLISITHSLREILKAKNLSSCVQRIAQGMGGALSQSYIIVGFVYILE